MRRPGVAVEMRDREIIGAIHDTLLELSRLRGRRINGLFTEDPRTLLESGAANPNYAASPPNPIFVVAPPFPAESAIKSLVEVEEARDSDEDASKYGWFGFEDMTTYDLGSLDFSEGGCKHNEQSVCIIINEKRPKKKPKRNGEGVLLFQSRPEEAPILQMAAANPNYAVRGPSTAAALEGWDSADDFSKNDFVILDFSDE